MCHHWRALQYVDAHGNLNRQFRKVLHHLPVAPVLILMILLLILIRECLVYQKVNMCLYYVI